MSRRDRLRQWIRYTADSGRDADDRDVNSLSMTSTATHLQYADAREDRGIQGLLWGLVLYNWLMALHLIAVISLHPFMRLEFMD